MKSITMNFVAVLTIENEEQASRLSASFAQLHHTMVDLQRDDYDGGFGRISQDLHRIANGLTPSFASTNNAIEEIFLDGGEVKGDFKI